MPRMTAENLVSVMYGLDSDARLELDEDHSILASGIERVAGKNLIVRSVRSDQDEDIPMNARRTNTCEEVGEVFSLSDTTA